MSLDQFADRVGEVYGARPSKAKLSRIETGKQPVPIEMVPSFSKITGITAADLRPDVAALMTEKAPSDREDAA